FLFWLLPPIRTLSPWLNLPLGLAVFAAALVLLKGVTAEDWRFVRRAASGMLGQKAI
ncbi:MAG: hypothetical protein JRJ59_12700, partial [Deltaproteobacteria bacterium]|nr:hypothetical protein [Deltaproteobacteria bacterium]